MEAVNNVVSIRTQASPGTAILTFNLKSLFSGTGTDSYGGELFDFATFFFLVNFSSLFFPSSSLSPHFLAPNLKTQNRPSLYLEPLHTEVDRHGIPAGERERKRVVVGALLFFLEAKKRFHTQKKTPHSKNKKGIDWPLDNPRGGLCDRHPWRRRDLDDLPRPFVGRDRDLGAHGLQLRDAGERRERERKEGVFPPFLFFF